MQAAKESFRSPLQPCRYEPYKHWALPDEKCHHATPAAVYLCGVADTAVAVLPGIDRS